MPKLLYNALLSEKEKCCTLDCGCKMSRPYADEGEPGSVAITFCKRHDKATTTPADLSTAALHIALDTFLASWEGNPIDVIEALEEDTIPNNVVVWEPMEIRTLPELAKCIHWLKRQILAMLNTELGIEV